MSALIRGRGLHRRTHETWEAMRCALADAEQRAEDDAERLAAADQLVRRLVRERDAAERRAGRVPELERDLAEAQHEAESAVREVVRLRSQLANARSQRVPAPADGGARDQAALAETAPVDVRALMADDDPTRPLYRVETLRDALGGVA